MGASNMLQRVLNVISRPPTERRRTEIDVLLPWLRRRSKLLEKLEREVLITLVTKCEYAKASRDDILIQQGDIGDCFYVMLTGRTSVYVDPLQSGEEQQGAQPQVKVKEAEETTDDEIEDELDEDDNGFIKKLKSRDRSHCGRFITYFEAGQSFGEVALMTKESLRNATIVVDDDTDLLVIQRELFNGTLKAKQEEEYAERQAFINSCRLFEQWTPKFKRFLEICIHKETFMFDSVLVQQGEPVVGMHFMTKSQAKQVVDPSLHMQQYPKLFDSSNSALAKELGKAFEKKEKKEKEKSSLNEQIRVRRREGYVAAERRLARKSTTVCYLNDIIGALEVVLGLETYVHSVRCTAKTEVFFLDLKSIDRLITKRNTQTLEDLRQCVEAKLRVRRNRHPDLEIYAKLLQKAVDMQPPKKQASVTTKKGGGDADREAEFSQMVRLYMNNRAPMIQSNIPDSVYYMAKAMDRARRPPSVESALKRFKGLSPEMRLQRAKRFASHRRRARSRRELEQLTVANEVEQYQLRDQEHVVNRYFTQMKPENRLHGNTHIPLDTGDETDDHPFKSAFGGDLGRGEDSYGLNDQKVIAADDLTRAGVRDAVVELTGLQSSSKSSRARIICSMIERRQRAMPSAIQQLLRPKSAPSSHRGQIVDDRDADSDSEVADFDAPTGDSALNDLESKIRDFHTKNTKEGMRPRMQVASMKRFNIQNPDDVPVPGGTVFVKQRPCAYTVGTNVNSAHHMHVRRFIVPRNAAEIATQSMHAFQKQAVQALQDDAKSSGSSSRASPTPTAPSPSRRSTRQLRSQSAPQRHVVITKTATRNGAA